MSTEQPPSNPASPELPESVRQAIRTALPVDRTDSRIVAWPVNYEGTVTNIIAALAPLWPGEDKPPTLGAVLVAAREHRDRPTPTPSPVAGLLTVETDAFYRGSGGVFDGSEATFARSLERRLAAARAEVERVRKHALDQWGEMRDSYQKLLDEKIAIDAQLATAKEELAEKDETITGLRGLDIANENIIASLRSDLAKANAAVEAAKRERDEAYKVISDLRLGPPGGKPVSNELKAHLNELSEQAYERASKKGNLEP